GGHLPCERRRCPEPPCEACGQLGWVAGRSVDQEARDAVLYFVLLDPEERDQVAEPRRLPELDQNLEGLHVVERPAACREGQCLHAGNGSTIARTSERMGGEDAHLHPEPRVGQPRAEPGGRRVRGREEALARRRDE